MPLATRLQVLESRLHGLRDGIGLTKLYVYDLRLDAIRLLTEMDARGLDFPVVLVDGRIVCSGEVDIDAVMAAATATVLTHCVSRAH